ncbi:MAG TPA: Crp/Fnr family transcriptional regulator [Bacteroidales bacterium]|nr:Crp/Fnr family transcriptional regulator [Bacteroidales bacterium]
MKKQCEDCAFRNEICRFIDEEEFSELNETTLYQHSPKGQTIVRQGDPMTHLLYLSSGLVKLEHVSPNKQIQIPALIKGPALISGNYQISGANNLLSVVAVEETNACLIDLVVLQSRMRKNAMFAMTIYDMLTAFHQRVLDKQLMLACKRVPGRIAGILLLFREKFYNSNEFSFPLTRREISHLTSCSEENVIRTLSSFEQDGIITLSGKSVKILHPEKLKRIYDIG